MKPLIKFLVLTLLCGATLGCRESRKLEASPQVQESPKVDALGLLTCNLPDSGVRGSCDVSMIDVIANQAKYNGKKVLFTGFVHFAFEGNGVYIHREDLEHHLYGNGFWIDLAAGLDPEKCRDSYALVEGTYSAIDRGHLGLWSGSILATRCEARH